MGCDPHAKRRGPWVLAHRRDLSPRFIARAVASRVLVKSGLCSLFVTTLDGYRLRFYPSVLSRFYWTYAPLLVGDERRAAKALGTGVIEVMALLRRLLHPGDLFIDAGANIGALACLAASRVGAGGGVYAFEPHPAIFEFLLGNVHLNGYANVRAYNYALGDTARDARLVLTASDEAGHITQDPTLGSPMEPGGGGLRGVKMRRLDDVDTGRGEVALLKVDVEGFEGAVLHGARRTLPRCRAVVFEASDRLLDRYGWTAAQIIRLMEAGGFHVFRPRLEEGILRRVRDGYQPTEDDEHENLIAVKDAHELGRQTGWQVDPEPG